jgi:hypothetical protein
MYFEEVLCNLKKHRNVAVKVVVGKKLVAVEGPPTIVVCGGSGSEGQTPATLGTSSRIFCLTTILVLL